MPVSQFAEKGSAWPVIKVIKQYPKGHLCMSVASEYVGWEWLSCTPLCKLATVPSLMCQVCEFAQNPYVS